jgi:hypothetical protein
MIPMSVELIKFFFLEEMWHCKLMTPDWSMGKLMCPLSRDGIWVLDCLLIENGTWEGPNIIFINTVIN